MAMSTSESFMKITKLNGKNYRTWAFNMRLYLESFDLFRHADGSAEAPDEEAAADVKKAFESAAKKAWTHICLAIEPEQQIHVRDTRSAKEAWDALKSQFARESILQKVRLRQQYYSCRFQNGSNMLEHINNLRSLHDQLKEMGVDIDDKELAMTLLASLPENFKPLITALDAVGEANLSFEKVKGMLLNDADRVFDARKSEDAFSVQRGNRGKNWRRKVETGKNEVKPDKPFRGTCHFCQERGHFARDCPKRSAKYNPQHGTGKDKRSAHRAEGEEEDEAIDQEALITSDVGNKGGWIIDSGATQHMTFEKNRLSNYVEFKQPCTVNLGDNHTILAYGKGSYSLVADLDGHTQNIGLQEVLYLPDLEKNLLSVHAMAKFGASVEFAGKQCRIMRNSKLLAIGEMCGKLYILKVVPEEHVHVARKEADMYLWHCRFGHLGMDNISKLINGNMVVGLNSSRDGEVSSTCESCIMGKQHRTAYPKGIPYRASEPFEIVHSDVCGPMDVNSFGSSRYFVTFIDDYSRYTQTYFIKRKDEVLEKFKEFVNYATNTSGKKVKVLRSDNGGEYCSKAFDAFMKENGIVHQTTVPYNPAQNGVAERMNRTLLESARSMMFHSKMPNEFWAEAVNTAAYVRNRSPTSSLQGLTPFECLFNRKPDVSNLRVFGCVAYSHIPENKRKKLQEKSRKCVFVGYPDGTKGFKLYDLSTKSFIRSQDVIFDEKMFHDFSSEHLSKPNSDPAEEEFLVKPLIVQTEADDRNANDADDQQPAAENDIPVHENHNNPVGETYEDTFMREVENLNAKRQRKPPARFDEELYTADDLTADINEPRNISEAWNGNYNVQWRKATDSEYESLIENNTWELVPLPEGKNVVGSRWVFKVKRDGNGSVERFKARLVAQGYSQAEGIDYQEVFSPVVRNTSIRSLLALANTCNWEIHQADVKTAFLQGDLDEEIYMKQPDGYVSEENPNHVCKLKKSLYGLKQAARCWNSAIDGYLKSNGYKQVGADSCLYMKSVKQQNGKIDFVILSIHVDDILLFSNSVPMLNEEKVSLGTRFKIEDLGEVNHVLGMLIKRDRESRTLTISQPKYLEGMLKRFGMQDCKTVSTPMEPGKQFHELSENEDPINTHEYQKIIGCLTYVTTATRPDLASAVGILSKYVKKPGKEHWQGVKRILRYVQGTLNYGLVYQAKDKACILTGYSDADWAGDVDTRRSTSGYVFQIQNSTISWCSKRQSCVSKSSTEAEYMALSLATQEAVWLRRLLNDIGLKQQSPSLIYEDNQGAIELSRNPKFHKRTKHIDIAFHFVREKVCDNIVNIQYCQTDEMLADVMTKGLSKPIFERFRERLGVKEVN